MFCSRPAWRGEIRAVPVTRASSSFRDTPRAMALPRRSLGSTGLEVSVLGFGGSPLGGVFHDVDEDVAVESVHEAFRLGINFFDTSPYYADTKVPTVCTASPTRRQSRRIRTPLDAQSEAVLGKALKDLPRSEIVVATKVGRYGPEIKDFDFSAERVTRSVEESLERLQVEYIDIIQLHDVEFGDLNQIIDETIPALLKIKESGKVRHIGITGLPFFALRYVIDRVQPGVLESVLSYCHYCLNDDSLVAEMPYFSKAGLGIINASPLSMGLLTHQGPPDWHPAPPALLEAAREAAALCQRRGVDLPKVAVSWALQNEGIATTLVGMCQPEQVRANVRTALQALGLEENADKEKENEALAAVIKILEPVRNVSWPSGRTENNGATVLTSPKK